MDFLMVIFYDLERRDIPKTPRSSFSKCLARVLLFLGVKRASKYFIFLKLIKNSLPHPWCQLFSLLSELLSPASPLEEQLRWTLRKTFQENETMQTGHRIWSSQKSSMNYFSTIHFCACRVGVVGIGGGLCLADGERSDGKREGR